MLKTASTKTLPLIVLLLGILLWGCWPIEAAQAKSLKQTRIDTVIIRSATLGLGSAWKPDGAILITRPDEIAQYKALFSNNNQRAHACGYSYYIEFWSGNQREEVIAYNMECGLEAFARNNKKISELMQSIDRQFQAGPVETLYYINVPAAREPTDLLQTMRQDGLHVYPFDSLDRRYPSLTIDFTYSGKDSKSFEKNAERESELFLAHWPKNMPQPLGYTKPVSNYSMHGPGQVQMTLRSKVWFALGVNIQAVAAAIATDRIKIADSATPAYYRLALIHPETDREKIKILLQPYAGVALQ